MNDELVYGNEPTYNKSAVMWALLVTLGVGMAWGIASVFTGWRLAWAALGVAVVIAMAWKPAAYEPSVKSAVWAVLLVFLSAGVALGTATMVGKQHVSGRELRTDPGLLKSAVRDWMYANDEITDPLAVLEQAKLDAQETIDADEPGQDSAETQATEEPQAEPEPAPKPVRTEVLVRERIANMDEAGQRDIVAWYVRQPGGQQGRQSTVTRAWRVMDAVWLLAAGWIAFRLCAPAREDGEE